jgi:uncharacterized protein (TIGR03032 family)
MQDGVPRYVTAVSKSDTIDGGIVIDVQTGDIVIGGLSMPHSPRLYREKLWVLNSGTGEIGWIEPAAKVVDAKFHALAFCPGFDEYFFLRLVQAAGVALSALMPKSKTHERRRSSPASQTSGVGKSAAPCGSDTR